MSQKGFKFSYENIWQFSLKITTIIILLWKLLVIYFLMID